MEQLWSLLRRTRLAAAGTAAGVLLSVALYQHALYITALTAVNNAYTRFESPYFEERPLGIPVDCVVLHATVLPTRDETLLAFQDPLRRVSAHFVVDKKGCVVQCVPLEKRAWHAGKSQLYGKPDVNSRSIGIEIVNRNDGYDPYTPEQYAAVARLIRRLRTVYAIPDAHIVSHAQIAVPAGRKTDPLGFDFPRLRRMLR